MGRVVAILENDPGRIAEMKACLSETYPGLSSVIFTNSRQMIGWLVEHLQEVAVMSLDHDLALRQVDGQAVDDGNGQEVVDYLISLPPACPVIVHSSNPFAAAGMVFALKDAEWRCSRVYPYDDVAWIRTEWIERVRQVL